MKVRGAYSIVEPVSLRKDADDTWRYVKINKDEEVTEGGLILPNAVMSSMKKDAQVGIVIHTGPDSELKEGDVILYGKYAAREIDYQGNYLHCLLETEDEVFAVIEHLEPKT